MPTSVSKEEALLKDKTSRKYEIKGKYGPNGGSVDVIANDLKENQRYEAHFVDTHYNGFRERAYKTYTDIVFNETLSIPLKGDPSQSATFNEEIDETDPDRDDQSRSYSDNQADDLSAPSQNTGYDTGPSGGGVLSYAAGAVGSVVLDTLDPAGVIRGAAGALGTLALAAAVDPAIQQAYDELGPIDTFFSWFTSLGAEWDKNAALNRQQNAGNGQLRAGSRPTIAGTPLNPKGGSAYANAGKAAAEIKELGRDVRNDLLLELTTGVGVAAARFQKARKGAKVLNGMQLSEAKRLLSGWDKATFNTLADSIRYHAKKHGFSGDIAKYLRKADNFNKKGALVKRLSDGAIRYTRPNGEFLIERNGKIISYGIN